MRKILKKIVKGFLLGILFILLLLYIPYLWSPIYNFDEPKPFFGELIYNPYKDIDTAKWEKALLHGHTKSWSGITDGNTSEKEYIQTYKTLGYEIIGISNYQKFTVESQIGDEQLNNYEHGYGITKNHHLILGGQKVCWWDFFYYQTLHQKQYMLHRLLTTADFVAINHPRFSRAMYVSDMKYLSDYHCLEVLNKFSNSVDYWDTALSAGKPVFLTANDDVHNVKNIRELARRIIFVNADISKKPFIEALKTGKSYGVDLYHDDKDNLQTKAARIKNLPKLIRVSLINDTIGVVLNKKVAFIRFIGQNGVIKHTINDVNQAEYRFLNIDTYIRTEIGCYDGSVIFLNPVFRYTKSLVKHNTAQIDVVKTNIKRFFVLILIFFLLLIVIRRMAKWYKITWNKLFPSDYYKILFLLMALSAIIRAFFAYKVELGNDEVYYLTYAMYPDFSHFDHPPMVGWFIQLFSLNLYFKGEIFVRLSSIILMTVNTYFIFLIGRHIKNELAGLFAAVLYNATIYGFIISGVFILPDTPQVFFWILALYYMVKVLPTDEIASKQRYQLLLLGVIIGLSALSKHSSVFLWVGAGLYILFYNRKWLKIKEFYISAVLSILILLPVLYWNYQNDFISFTFQGNRVGVSLSNLHWDYFFTELLGQVFYINPFVVGIILYSVILSFRASFRPYKSYFNLLILCGIPIIVTFLFFSLFKKTLPHWACPGYISLLILSAVVLATKVEQIPKFPRAVKVAIIFMILIVIAGFFQINHGLFRIPIAADVVIQTKAKNDPTADLYGWRQAAEKFDAKYGTLFQNADSAAKIHFVHYEWFPAAHIDYYIARQYNKQVQVIGSLDYIHKYHWINKKYFALKQGDNAFYLTNSRYFKEPADVLATNFQTFQCIDTIEIHRDAEVVNYLFVYLCKDFQQQSVVYLNPNK